MKTRQQIIDSILAVGLHVDERGNLYGPKYEASLRPGGLWQHPEELADLLLFLGTKDIASFLNIGTFNGATFNLMADYLNSIRPTRCITVDPLPHGRFVKPEYQHLDATSEVFAGEAFDFVFIDGHHGYAEAKADFENVGQHAAYCAFHDIDDVFIRADPTLGGGVCRLWDELKPGRKTVEIVAPCKPRLVMGIGVIVK